MNKQEVINNLDNMIKYYNSKNETSRKERIKQVKRLVTKSNIQEYNNMILSQIRLKCKINKNKIGKVIYYNR